MITFLFDSVFSWVVTVPVASSVVFNNAVVCVCDLCHCSVVRSDQSRNWLWFDPQRDLDQYYCRLIVNYAMIM